MKSLHFIQVVPDALRFYWEVAVQLYNFREYGYSEKAHVIIFLPKDRLKEGYNIEWAILEKLFPETEFIYIRDSEEGRVNKLINAFSYIPILRLTCLEEYFKGRDCENDAYFYHDADVLFTKYLDFSPFLDDNTCYLSDTRSYINSDYFDSKLNDVVEIKKEAYQKEDILNKCAKICSTSRDVCVLNKDNSGGAQYLLKGKALTSHFWTDVLNNCAELRVYLASVNDRYFPGHTFQDRENKGIQRWCSDMFSLLFNLWSHGLETSLPKELEFAWSTDERERLNDVYIYHNAGVTSEAKFKRKVDKEEVEAPAFYKGKDSYVKNILTPFDDMKYLNEIISHPISKLYANSWYVEQIIKTKQSLNL